MPLSALAIKNARPKDSNYKLSDERGLYLLITPKGSKLWHFKFRFNGKEKKLNFGPFPEVSLQAARAKRDEARAAIAAGIDPAREKQAKKIAAKIASGNTFESVALEFISKREQENAAPATTGKMRWLLSLVAGKIGKLPVADISPQELLAVLTEIQNSGRRETARRLRSFAGRVFNYAVATGRATQNPAHPLQGALITPTVHHHPAIIEFAKLRPLLRAIETYEGYPSTCGALRISPHLFQRPGEIRTMKWEDLDLNEARWTISETAAKMRRRHDVPLSRQVIEIIRSMKNTSGDSEFVFPAFHSPKRPLSENTVNQALRRLGYVGVMTAHGFRSTASSLLNESSKWNPDAIERALAHKVGGMTRASYNHTPYWLERVEMMQWWSDQLDELCGRAT